MTGPGGGASTLPVVLSTAESRAVDQRLVELSGLPSLLLMENAGRGIAAVASRLLTERASGQRRHDAAGEGGDRVVPEPARWSRVAIVCGPGNNGGDGFVVARHLSVPAASDTSAAAAPPPRITLILASHPAKLGGDAATMFRALDASPTLERRDLSAAGVGRQDWDEALADHDVIVDALFGTGLRAPVTGGPALAIAAINHARQAGAQVIAVDVPSGLDADTGRPTGPVVEADVTATLGAHKVGLLVDAAAVTGTIEVLGLGVALPSFPASTPQAPRCHLLTDRAAQALLPRRAASAFKGTSGHLMVVAGSAGKTGAALLVARAAMRAGAGLVTVATTAAGQVSLDAKVVEVMTASYASGEDADAGSAAALAELFARPQVRALALGPGIPAGPGMRALVRDLVSTLALPMVIDADGLNALGAEGGELLAGAPAPRVITPHPGEMARLIGQRTEAVQADRLGVARRFAAVSGAVVVLKGARTVIATRDGAAFISPIAEAALATAGSGDVLTGVLGSLLVQGLPPLQAAQLAVMWHGRAGTRAAALHGSQGVLAGDLPEALAELARDWSAGWAG